MAKSTLFKSPCQTWTTIFICNVAILAFVALIMTIPCCESKPSAGVTSDFAAEEDDAVSTDRLSEAVGGGVDPLTAAAQSYDNKWRACVESAKPMARVQWNKMYGVWFADSTSDPSDGITCAMTRFDKFTPEFDNGIVVTKLFTLKNVGAEGQDSSSSDAAEDRPESVQTLEPAIGWLDAVEGEEPANSSSKNNGTVHAGSMTLIHALNSAQQQQANAGLSEENVNSGLLLRIYLIKTDYINYAVFHTCALFSESGHVTQTVHVTTRSPWSFNQKQRNYVAQRAELGRLYGGSAADNYGQSPFSKQHCPAVARIIRKSRAAPSMAVVGETP